MNTIKDIVMQHPQSVALLFQKYGYSNLPITERSTAAMAVKFKQPFVRELAALVTNNYDVFVGATGKKTLVKKKSATVSARDTRNKNATPSLLRPIINRPAITGPAINAPKITEEAINKHLEKVQQALPTAEPEKKSVFDRVLNIFNKALPALQAGAGIIAAAKGKTPGVMEPQQETAETKKSNKVMYIGIAIVAIIVLYVLFKPSKTAM